MTILRQIVRALVALLAIAFSGLSLAQQAEPIVEISVTPEQVLVGEPVTLRVSVFVPTWFAKPVVFPSFEIPNAITRLPPESTGPAVKMVGRERWSGVTRRYQIYPLMGAAFRLEGESMEVHYANPGEDPLRARVDIGEFVFSAVVPEGAEGLEPYVAGTRFELSRSIDGDIESLGVGDAVVVTYTAELDGLSAIFIPELTGSYDVAGVSVYPDQPVVEEGPPARRTEKLTFIFNAGGEFEIPATSIDWWNTETNAVQTASVDSLPISVAGPVPEETPVEERQPIDWKLIAAIALVLFVLWRWLPPALDRLRSELKEKERLERASEPYAWKQAKKALASGDAQRAHEELVTWIARLDARLDPRGFALRFGDEALVVEMETMYRSLYAESGETPDLDRMSDGLGRARERCLAAKPDLIDAALPPMNP